MNNPYNVPIRQVQVEFDRTLVDVKRQIQIFVKRGNFEPIDPVSFVDKYFYLSLGQRYVLYDHVLDLTCLADKLLANYPRAPEVRTQVVNVRVDVPSLVTVSMPFGTREVVEMQAENVASKSSTYDFALEVKGPRRFVNKSIGDDMCVIDKATNGAIDIAAGPDSIEKKPFSCRRDFLISNGFKVVPMTETIDGSLLVKDSEPYVSGGTGGYFKTSYSEEINVLRKVESNMCQFLVRGSLVGNQSMTSIRTIPVIENDGEDRVRVNLKSNEVVCKVKFINDIIDYYTVQYSLPRSSKDVKLRRGEENDVIVIPVEAHFKGDVTGVGFRRRLFALYYGSRVRIRIENVGSKVVMEGDIAHDDLVALRHKSEAFAHNNKVEVDWIIKESVRYKSVSWEVQITA